jgi:hypothetical protein
MCWAGPSRIAYYGNVYNHLALGWLRTTPTQSAILVLRYFEFRRQLF